MVQSLLFRVETRFEQGDGPVHVIVGHRTYDDIEAGVDVLASTIGYDEVQPIMVRPLEPPDPHVVEGTLIELVDADDRPPLPFQCNLLREANRLIEIGRGVEARTEIQPSA